MAYEINYDDERFQQVESDKNAAISEMEKTYSGMINESDAYYQKQIDASKEWEKKQTEIQNEQTDFAIEKIEQQKDQEHKDYIKEQSGSYVDWQKQSNEYGAKSEEIAAGGMTNTGYAESSQVSMYNTYQNRVATAREAYKLAVLNYDNAIKDARLQNNAALAEIAKQALEQQLELALKGFQYKNTLLLEQANKKTELEQMYHGRYQDVLAQINHEHSLAEQIRQFNESMALEREQFEWQKEQAAAKASSGGGGGGGRSKISGGNGNDTPQIKRTGDIEKLKTKATEEAEFNQAVLDLGYGPISAANLDKKVASGEVREYTEDGKTVFRRAGSSNTNSNATIKRLWFN